MQIQNDTIFFDKELSKSTVPELWKKLSKKDLISITKIDLSKLEKIDSAGIAFLDERPS
jgi:ABC-type transporter Mla MlaB component